MHVPLRNLKEEYLAWLLIILKCMIKFEGRGRNQYLWRWCILFNFITPDIQIFSLVVVHYNSIYVYYSRSFKFWVVVFGTFSCFFCRLREVLVSNANDMIWWPRATLEACSSAMLVTAWTNMDYSNDVN